MAQTPQYPKGFQLDLKVAMEQYRLRKKANQGKMINNSSLPAGSPMYFYCRFCEVPTATLSENYTVTPSTICDPCGVLHLHGLLPEQT